MKHAMVDIETMGLKVNAAIISIGAVLFDPHGEIGPQMHVGIHLWSSLQKGLQVEAETLEWWVKNNVETFKRNLEVSPSYPLPEALRKLSEFLAGVEYVWARGTDFDIPRLRNACQICGLTEPWDHSNVRDLRTLEMVVGGYKRPDDMGNYHCALEDAVYQAKCVIACFDVLRSKVIPPPVSKPLFCAQCKQEPGALGLVDGLCRSCAARNAFK